MRMQKKDLAKEFSLVVQQEIKNHNESILACNMTLDEFRRKLAEIKSESEKNIAEIRSNLSLYDSKVILFKEAVQKELDKCARDISDNSGNVAMNVMKLKKAIEDRESYYLTLDGFKEFQSKVDVWIASIQQSFARNNSSIFDEIKRINSLHNASIEEHKKYVDSRLTNIISASIELEKSLDEFAVTFSGVSREMEICKKRCFVIEKNIENIYIQLERSKAGQK